MRTLESARAAWSELAHVETVADLREQLTVDPGDPRSSNLRSVSWKISLLFSNLDRSTWALTLAESRAAYASLRDHLLKAIDNPNEFDSATDPLSDNDESPWIALRQDEALRAEIFQDVDRTMPENLYFRKPSTQDMLVDMLFIFCKLNPDVGYRQGMHEVLAPMLWVVERDAIDPESAARHGSSDDVLVLDMFNAHYIEHDTFSIFGIVMRHVKAFYDPAAQGSADGDSAILSRCKRIFLVLLPGVDPGLASHLQDIDVLPQLFLMRWIRLLFGREFPFDDVLSMWDMIFLEDPSLRIIDFICVALLLRVRWQLIDADANEALSTLLRYPDLPTSLSPQTFVDDAVQLKNDFTTTCADRLVQKYTGRTPAPVSPTRSQPSPSPMGTSTPRPAQAASPFGRLTSPSSRSHGLEALLQSTARGMISRGERWGVHKALKDAMDDVIRNVQGLQPSRSSTLHLNEKVVGTSTAGLADQTGVAAPDDLLRQISTLGSRNKTLASMLESAVAELWAYQGTLPDQKQSKDSTDSLNSAIAKVQIVQVYLDHPTLPLSADESHDQVKVAEKVHSPEFPPTQHTPLEDAATRPASSEGPSRSTTSGVTGRDAQAPSPARSTPTISEAGGVSSPHQPATASATGVAAETLKPTSLHRPRPSLAQSSFSWMLDPTESGQSFASGIAHHERRHGATGMGFLFGESEEDEPMAKGKGRGRARDRATGDAMGEVFSLETLESTQPDEHG